MYMCVCGYKWCTCFSHAATGTFPWRLLAVCWKRSDLLNCHVSNSFCRITTAKTGKYVVNVIVCYNISCRQPCCPYHFQVSGSSLMLFVFPRLLHSSRYLFLDGRSRLLGVVKLNKCKTDRAIRSSIQAPLTLSEAAASTSYSLCFTGETPPGHSLQLYSHLKTERLPNSLQLYYTSNDKVQLQ